MAAVDDGLGALRYLETTIPDAIVLDMALPRLGGGDVLNELRANPLTSSVPILIVTGTDIDSISERMFTPVLQKPVDPEVLVSAIDGVVRRGVNASGRP